MPPSIGWGQEVIECFDEREKDVNPLLWPLQSPDFILTEYQWEILDQHIRRSSQPPTSKYQVREYLWEEWCSPLQQSSRDL